MQKLTNMERLDKLLKNEEMVQISSKSSNWQRISHPYHWPNSLKWTLTIEQEHVVIHLNWSNIVATAKSIVTSQNELLIIGTCWNIGTYSVCKVCEWFQVKIRKWKEKERWVYFWTEVCWASWPFSISGAATGPVNDLWDIQIICPSDNGKMQMCGYANVATGKLQRLQRKSADVTGIMWRWGVADFLNILMVNKNPLLTSILYRRVHTFLQVCSYALLLFRMLCEWKQKSAMFFEVTPEVPTHGSLIWC